MTWSYQRRVRYYETDRMGVVHHSNYLRLIEDARMDWIQDHIMNYNEMEKMGIIIPAASASGNFRTYLKYDDPFSVEVKLSQFSGVRMKFAYQIYHSETGKLCYEGESVHFFATGEDYHPFSIKRKFPELYEKFKNCMESDPEQK